MAKASRDKGKAGELEVAHVFQGQGFSAYRTPNSGAFFHAKGDINGVPGLHIEVKRAERLEIPSWLAQCEADCPELDIPVLVFRRSRDPWRVILPLEDFAPLWRVQVAA